MTKQTNEESKKIKTNYELILELLKSELKANPFKLFLYPFIP